MTTPRPIDPAIDAIPPMHPEAMRRILGDAEQDVMSSGVSGPEEIRKALTLHAANWESQYMRESLRLEELMMKARDEAAFWTRIRIAIERGEAP